MAWLAVNENGDEFIYDEKPFRLNKRWDTMDEVLVRLTKGCIEKLIGRGLTWKDEPVKLKEGSPYEHKQY